MKYVFASLLLPMILINPLTAQEILVADNPGIESELSIVLNPNNPNQLIVTSMRVSNPIQVFSSEDGGQNWQQSSFATGSSDPVLEYGDNGSAFLTFLDFGSTLELHLGTSTDNGATWDTQRLVLDGLPADRPWIRRDNSSLSPFHGSTYVTYFHPSGVRDIHIVRIDANGNVGANQSVSSPSFQFTQNPILDINKQGDIVICFVAQAANGSFSIMSVNSSDGSATFSPETQVAAINTFDTNGDPLTDVVGFAPGNFSRLGNSLHMAIDKSDGPNSGRAYATWTDFVAGNAAEGLNVYLSYSDDNGETWSAPKIVNDDSVPSSHQYYSAIDVNPNGVVVLSWYDRRADPVNDDATDFYLTYSTDGGDSFVESIKLNSLSSNHSAIFNGLSTFGVGEYTEIVASEEFAFAVWADGRDNNGNMNVYFRRFELPPAFVLGDVNGDGVVDLLDVSPFVDLLTEGKFNPAADIDGSGQVDLLDVFPFVALLLG